MTLELFNREITSDDLDVFGHVNNANYLKIYEEARWELITKRGYGLEKIQSTGKGPVILEVNIKFKRELKLGEHITIETSAREVKRNKIMYIDQKMIKDNQDISSEAVFTIGFFDLKERKLIEPDQDWLTAIGL